MRKMIFFTLLSFFAICTLVSCGKSKKGNPNDLDPNLIEYSKCLIVDYQSDKYGVWGTVTNNCPIDVCDLMLPVDFYKNGQELRWNDPKEGTFATLDYEQTQEFFKRWDNTLEGRLEIDQTRNFAQQWGKADFEYDSVSVSAGGLNFYYNCK